MPLPYDIFTINDAWGRPEFTGRFRRYWLPVSKGVFILMATERLA